MVQGDVCDIHIQVREGAQLGLTAQGANRIYKSEGQPATTHLQATVASRGTFVVAPDPCVLFQDAHYQQTVDITLQDETSSLILVDWFSAGRLAKGEYWSLHGLSTRTVVRRGQKTLLRDSIALDKPSFSAATNCWFGLNAFCTVTLVGPQSQHVLENLHSWSTQLASRYTSVRESPHSATAAQMPLSSLGPGTVWVGVSQGNYHPDLAVARIAAFSNEDIYRILHAAMEPLCFGLPFYQDRIQSSSTLIMPTANMDKKEATIAISAASKVNPTVDTKSSQSLSNLANQSLWPAFMLVDASLPTGSFAHSAGLEVAQQFGLLHPVDALEQVVSGATKSALKLQLPLVVASFDAVTKFLQGSASRDQLLQEWAFLDEYMHTLLISNAPACEASRDLGQGLLRVALAWCKDIPEKEEIYQTLSRLRRSVPHGHLASLFGGIVLLWGVDSALQASRILGYAIARDLISAAVRLNTIGPLASVRLLGKLEAVVEEAVAAVPSSLEHASSCAPMLDVLHPHHELLAVRLFRS
jgi:urease accessory protein UreF